MTRSSSLLRIAIIVLLLATGGGLAILATYRPSPTSPAARVPLATATVVRSDLVSRETFTGRLGYRSRGTLHLTTGGVVTGLPRVGQTLTRGSIIATVDDQPVAAMYGTGPLFRTLAIADTEGDRLSVEQDRSNLLAARLALTQARATLGAGQQVRIAQAQSTFDAVQFHLSQAEVILARASEPERGADVAEVAANLVALGYLSEPTSTWSATLANAVSVWQRRTDQAVTGTLFPSEVAIVGGPSRVSAVSGQAGDPATAVSIALSSPTAEASFHIRGAVPPGLRQGTRVRISSAAGRSVTATVALLRTGPADWTVQADISHPATLRVGERSRVTLTVIDAQREALTVPVQALLALASGGYALQLLDHRLVPVHVTVVGADQAEVSGPGVHAGQRVVSVT